MAITLLQRWVFACDKGDCTERVEVSGAEPEARTAVREEGWEILSRMSVRCPSHIRHPELIL